MSANASERTASDCTCECRDGGCPKGLMVEVPTPMSAELIKASYLQLQTVGEDPGELSQTASPIIDDLDALLPLLSDKGFYEWAKYVFRHGKETWKLDWPQQVRIMNRFDREVDERFPVPTDRSEVLRVLEMRDGSGCICRRRRPACGFQRDSGHLLQDYELAHILPRKRGGRHVWSNLALISPRCNQSQGSKQFLKWLEGQLGCKCTRFLTWPSNGPRDEKPDGLITTIRRSWGPKPSDSSSQS